MIKKGGLGRGLSSMIDPTLSSLNENIVCEIEISKVEPNKDQPRKNFDEARLEALKLSIAEMGVILPIIVNKADKKGFHTIVAGERRWRAAKMAGLKKIPVIIRDYDDKVSAEVALIENLQRENLDAVEEAKGYKSLMDGFSMTQEEISKKVGKSRSYITNTIRLLNLPDSVLKLLIEGHIERGHARAILGAPSTEDMEEIAKITAEDNLSVRQVEDLVKKYTDIKKPKLIRKEKNNISPELKSFSDGLSKKLGTKVNIKTGARKGKIEIEFYGNEDLERILKFIR